jgi:hypothetical protein
MSHAERSFGGGVEYCPERELIAMWHEVRECQNNWRIYDGLRMCR